METVKLTISFIKKLAPGSVARYADSEVPGLQVRVSATKISYYFRKRHNYKVYEFALGNHPDIMLEEARTMALEKLAALANYSDVSSPVAHKQPTVGEALELWLDDIKNKSHGKSVIRCWAGFEKRKIAELQPQDVERVFRSMSSTPISANHSVKALKAAINKLVKKFNIENPVPCLFDKIQFYPSAPRTRVLQESEAPKIIDELKKRQSSVRYGDQAKAMLLMLYTGQRRGRVLGITAEQIDIEHKVWHVPGNNIKRPVELSLNDSAWEIIEKQLSLRPSGHLFLWRGKPMKECRKTLTAVCEECGIKNFHIHDLRRSLGTWMLSSGASIAEVSKTLGHSSIRVTEQVYAHLLGSRARQATQTAVAAMLKGEV